MMAYYDVMESPVGALFIGGSDEGLHRLDFMDGERDMEWCVARLERDAGEPAVRDPEGASHVTAQLREYFAGERMAFDLRLAARGTPFQRQVWDALLRIPPGGTTSYGAIAAAVGQPSASRAVGAANGQNPLAIIVPCHRVVGSTGRLTGYAGGLDRKQWLLDHELSAASLLAGAAGPR